MATIYKFYIVEIEDDHSHNEIEFDTYQDARNFEEFLLSKVDILSLTSIVLKQISEFNNENK